MAVLVAAALVAVTAFAAMRARHPSAHAPHARGAAAAVLVAPSAERRVVWHEAHGDRREDPYAWLRDDDRADPEVLAYLTAENAYTRAVLADWQAAEEALYREIVGRIVEDDETVPEERDGYLYWERTRAGAAYPVYLRRPVGASADAANEEVLFDPNTAGEGHAFYSLGQLAVSPDGKKLAWLEDTRGDERYRLRVRDLRTGAILLAGVDEVAEVAWAGDSDALVYTVLDATQRPHQVRTLPLGAAPERAKPIFEEQDPAFYVSVARARSGGFVFVHTGSRDTREAWALPAATPDQVPIRVRARQQGVEDEVDHHGEHFYLRTNERAPGFRVLRAPIAQVRAGVAGDVRWEEVLPHDEEAQLEGMDLFADHLVVWERRRGAQEIVVRALASGATHRVELDAPVRSIEPGPNAAFATSTLRFEVSTLASPPVVYDYAIPERRLTVRKREVARGHDPARYVEARVYAQSPDGVEIPISLVHRRDLALDGTPPIYLYAYGAYGECLDPYFSWARVNLLERGFVFAIAHVRGGGELGRAWYEAGRRERKPNTFADVIACAVHLHREGYGAPAKTVLSGGSAGGLLVGAVLNQRPDLFGCAVADVPFVDVLTTMADPDLPLTVLEYEEWGDPSDRASYETMRTYSPYDNARAQVYPPMLVTAGLWDARVGYWEPAKWVARLRATKRGDQPLLLWTELAAGHGGASGRYDALRSVAMEHAFVLRALGLPKPR